MLLDGTAGSLDGVAPDNIGTTTVLRDAASAAIYLLPKDVAHQARWG